MTVYSLSLLLIIICDFVNAFDVIGHRGASGIRPEESSFAFTTAASQHASLIECDVQVSAITLVHVCAYHKETIS